MPIFYQSEAMTRVYKQVSNEVTSSLFVEFALRDDSLKMIRRFSSFDTLMTILTNAVDDTLEDNILCKHSNSYLTKPLNVEFDTEDYRHKYMLEQSSLNKVK